jgi:hypothetical protein
MPIGAVLLNLVAGAQTPLDLSLPEIKDTNYEQEKQDNYIGIALMIAIVFGGLYAISKIK